MSSSAHPLDRPVWSALTSRQADIALGGAHARRFAHEASPLCASQNFSTASQSALGELFAADEEIYLLEVSPPSPSADLVETFRAPCVQMTARHINAPEVEVAAEPLGDEDAAEMLALALLTKPGPFRIGTHKLGRFIGVRDNGQLIAMAGERLRPAGFTEVSAVCTHPEYRGRGFGGALLAMTARRILEEGATPFLHAYKTNTTAIALYRKLGFEVRAEVDHAIWKRPV